MASVIEIVGKVLSLSIDFNPPVSGWAGQLSTINATVRNGSVHA